MTILVTPKGALGESRQFYFYNSIRAPGRVKLTQQLYVVPVQAISIRGLNPKIPGKKTDFIGLNLNYISDPLKQQENVVDLNIIVDNIETSVGDDLMP
jgi:hypothetical protein